MALISGVKATSRLRWKSGSLKPYSSPPQGEGGIVANGASPADFLEDNLLIAANVMHAAAAAGVEKLLFSAHPASTRSLPTSRSRRITLFTRESTKLSGAT
jgi:hypothetical protein